MDFYEDISYNDISNEKKEECLISFQSNNFKLELTAIQPFPDRGSRATYSGKYRGDWLPYANTIKYRKRLEGHISLLAVEGFLIKMNNAAEEAFNE